MTDIIWKRDPNSRTKRYLYKPVSTAGFTRFSGGFVSDDNGWYGFGDWHPEHPMLTEAHASLILTPAEEYAL